MMVKVLIYAYCHGIMSSRLIARGLENDVGLRYLSANQQPDFRTIADFRKNNSDAIRGLHIEVLELCREAGLMKMGRVALDGHKVAGNAALARNRTREALEAEVRKILAKANTTDPDSRIMKTRTDYVQGYNCQAMVDC